MFLRWDIIRVVRVKYRGDAIHVEKGRIRVQRILINNYKQYLLVYYIHKTFTIFTNALSS